MLLCNFQFPQHQAVLPAGRLQGDSSLCLAKNCFLILRYFLCHHRILIRIYLKVTWSLLKIQISKLLESPVEEELTFIEFQLINVVGKKELGTYHFATLIQ